MKIEVLLFAALREIEGAEQVTIDVTSSTTYAELRNRLRSEHPRLGHLLDSSRFAAGNTMVADGQVVDHATRIALIPPVSGG